MQSRHLTLHEPDLLQKSNACPRRRGFEAAAGPLILHSFCSSSLVASLKAERGLHARPIVGTAAGADCCNVAKNTASPTKRGIAGLHRSSVCRELRGPCRYEITVREGARRAPHESKTRQLV